ncbi:hypothetical protein CI109_103411 [Kwoniella shandongensis]|uniref:Uncharacterized protein n=1 Tax=Kwoniella shandongensis TaxID=1734106 RepID=A0A5M6C1T8_9TREE|nr:uncharacterized protein CI109_004492 [Kwoniella shandongensis]KAA5527199.1 hypothetical protein CI109_004492 [Kwoniella shandongensis]
MIPTATPTPAPLPQPHPSPEELHLLYVLLDSNLPTGGFVSSSGLESYAKHGFLSSSSSSSSSYSSSSSSEPIPRENGGGGSKAITLNGVVEFARAEVGNYGNTTGGFVRASWEMVDQALRLRKGKGKERPMGGRVEGEEEVVDWVVGRIAALDRYHEATLLSHVARRSSKAQGVAMLTLFTRGLSRPVGLYHNDEDQGEDLGESESESEQLEGIAKDIVDQYKKVIRKGEAPGHLAICFGVMTRVLGLSLDRAIHLHLFLHARSLLSSAVRLNLIGPYASSQLLLHPFREIIDIEVRHIEERTIEIESVGVGSDEPKVQVDENDFWAWTEEAERGPATTWPLGEVLTGRHDLQHSRIFNS